MANFIVFCVELINSLFYCSKYAQNLENTSFVSSRVNFTGSSHSFLTVPEVNQLIDSFTNVKHKAEISLLYSSGIRVSELCRLHCGDIYVTKKHIYISKSKNRSDRYAVLADRVVPILKEYIRQAHPSATKDDWLFPGQKTGQHISTQSIYNELIGSMLLSAGRNAVSTAIHSDTVSDFIFTKRVPIS